MTSSLSVVGASVMVTPRPPTSMSLTNPKSTMFRLRPGLRHSPQLSEDLLRRRHDLRQVSRVRWRFKTSAGRDGQELSREIGECLRRVD